MARAREVSSVYAGEGVVAITSKGVDERPGVL